VLRITALSVTGKLFTYNKFNDWAENYNIYAIKQTGYRTGYIITKGFKGASERF